MGKKPILAMAGATLAFVSMAGNAPAEPLVLVDNGKAQASIIIDGERHPLEEDRTNQWATVQRTIHNIAAEVVEYVEKSTGARLPVIDGSAAPLPDQGILLHIGRSEYVDGLIGDEIDAIKGVGYIIRAEDDRNILIVGKDSDATEYGTYEFLERFVGVRWLMPTEVGEFVPKHADLSIPDDTDILDEPAFMQVPGLAFRPTHRDWARKMRFYSRLSFHHSLDRLFAPELFKHDHPEFYPLKSPDDEKRYVPSNDADYYWQPCFTAPGIVDAAAQRIIESMNDQTGQKTYSFGVNDSNDYCQCDDCRAEYIEGAAFLGLPSYTDLYMKWCNAVAEKVLEVHPDAWFGLIAYSHVGAPPVNVQVHPRIVPFMTYDTMQLIDPDRRERHERLLKEWESKCTYIGRYDYTYGDHHVPPRIYTHMWADYVRWARDHNVRAWYAETYPFFGEAPKYYVMAKIWWNPDRDVDQILDEWYRLSFGKAAPAMVEYFDHWEDYWTRRVKSTGHFSALENSQYCIGNRGFLEALTADDIKIGDARIKRALELADTPETRARVEVMALSWEYYRTVIDDYLARGKAGSRLTGDQAIRVLDMRRSTLESGVDRMYAIVDEHPILTFSWRRDYPYESSLRQPILDAGQALLTTGDARLATKFEELTGSGDAELAAQAGAFLAIHRGAAHNLVQNPGFEADDPLDGWWAGTHFGTGNVQISQHQPHGGESAVVVRSTWDGYGGVFRTDVPAEPGKSYILVLWARWEGEPAVGTVCQMLSQFFDDQGRAIPDTTHGHKFWPDGEWAAYLIQTPVAPEGTVSMNVRVDAMAQPKTGHETYFDDIEAYAVGN